MPGIKTRILLALVGLCVLACSVSTTIVWDWWGLLPGLVCVLVGLGFIVVAISPRDA